MCSRLPSGLDPLWQHDHDSGQHEPHCWCNPDTVRLFHYTCIALLLELPWLGQLWKKASKMDPNVFLSSWWFLALEFAPAMFNTLCFIIHTLRYKIANYFLHIKINNTFCPMALLRNYCDGVYRNFYDGVYWQKFLYAPLQKISA